MTTIRLLHISDLHICKFLNILQISKRADVTDTVKHFTVAPAYSPGTLSRFLAFLRQQRATLDGIIITGDIATTGRSFDLEKAFNVIKHRIEPMGVDLCLLPGNHDRWIPYRKGKDSVLFSLGYDPGGKDFHSLFGDFWTGDVNTFTTSRDNFRVAVITADLSLRSAHDAEIWKFINKHGQGKVYDDILKDLESATLRVLEDREITTAVLWAVHFPPFCPDIGSDLRLLDETHLLEKADELGVSFILAGHSHVGRVYDTLPYNTYVFCAGTLTQYNPAKNHFFIISLENLGEDYRVDVESYEFDHLRRKFIRT